LKKREQCEEYSRSGRVLTPHREQNSRALHAVEYFKARGDRTLSTN
jgi:hypothetical protein